MIDGGGETVRRIGPWYLCGNLNLSRCIVEDDPDRVVLQPNHARDLLILGVLTLFAGTLLAVGLWALVSSGAGFVQGWIVSGLGLPLALAAVARLPRLGRRDRIEIDRRAARIVSADVSFRSIPFREVTWIQTRERGPGIFRLLVESDGRPPLELLEGPERPLDRLGKILAAWIGVRHGKD